MLQGVELDRKRAVIVAIIAGVIAIWTLSGVVAEDASAQGPGSEFCEEYPDIPGCAADPVPTATEPAEPAEPAEPPAAPPATTAAAPTVEVDTGDELPFTGYPLTALILLLLILLLVGLAIRAYLAIRERVADDAAGR